MDIAEMIEEFQSRGVALWANGDRLGYRSPKGVLTREDLAALKARKEEVLAHLRERDAIGHDEQARFEPFPTSSGPTRPASTPATNWAVRAATAMRNCSLRRWIASAWRPPGTS